jgi:hypothetical protein
VALTQEQQITDLYGKIQMLAKAIHGLGVPLTDAERLALSNLSGTNTGDQDLSGLVPKTYAVNGKALSGDITLELASSDFANQGTATTVLHGNAAGNPSFGSVVLADIDAAALSGADAKLITGTPGTPGNLSMWNADGDLVEMGNMEDWDSNPAGLNAGTTGTVVAKHKVIAGIEFIHFQATLGGTGISVGDVSFTLPAASLYNKILYGEARDMSGARHHIIGILTAGSATCIIRAFNATGTFGTAFSSSAPFTWAATDYFFIDGPYITS